MMDEQEFKRCCDDSLNDLHRALTHASETYDIEADFNAGALSIEFEEPKGKFVVSPNTPVRQVWVSAHSKSYKLDWDATRRAFVLPATGQTLKELIAEAASIQLGETVTL